MTRARTLLAFALLALLAACESDPRHVRVSEGEALGLVYDGVRVFRSLPYAGAPVGELRWRAPQPAPRWGGVRDATAPGPLCTQNTAGADWGPWTGGFAPHGPVSEDCLTLSVWTPARSSRERLPVMVWIPGGGFTDGGEAMAVYDGAALARRGIIVVTINYRVAAFGLLAHPALQAEPDGAVGNYTLRDAMAALRWVHANIAAFGGDPGRVTIAGQSAGAALAYIMLDSPGASGLFHGAILQSFPPGSEILPDRLGAQAVGLRIAQELHATDAASLRAATADAVLHANGDGLNLYVDNVLIGDPRFASPPYLNDVPIMAGMTADELSFLSPNLARYREAAAHYGHGFSQLYPAADDAEALNAFLRSDREATMVGLQRWARGARGGAPMYLYLWDHVLPGPNAEHYRAFHSSEVIYMFGSFAAAPERPFTAEDRAISERMLGYWSNFVKTGNPNSEGVHTWPRADVEAPVFMELGDRFAPMAPLPAAVSAFFNAYDDTHDHYRF